MVPCTTCGNDIAEDAYRCEFCGAQQQPTSGAPRRRAAAVATINLERGMPTVDAAMRDLEFRLAEHRVRGTRLLRIIHGYGASGRGGGIKQATRTRLERLRRQKQIRGYLAGEQYAKETTAGRDLLRRFAQLEQSYVADRGNEGITFVWV